MTPGRSTACIAGLVLTWIGGSIGAVLLIPVLGLVSIAGGMATAGITDDPGLFMCRAQACVDEATVWTLAGLGVAAVAVVVIVLAAWSTTRSLITAAAISSVALAGAVVVLLEAATAGAYREVIALLLVVALVPGSLALGSVLRLWARRPSSGTPSDTLRGRSEQ